MLSIRSAFLIVFVAGAAHAGAYTDFTGIWDGSCSDSRVLSNTRSVVIMDSDAQIAIDGNTYKLPEGRVESVHGEDGDPMAPEHFTEEQHINYSWNDTKTEITLNNDWTAWPDDRPTQIANGYTHVHIRLVGAALEVLTQTMDANGGSTTVCTYPKRR